ncbi:MAG: prefoldin subunit beta [Candidatus Micrarchaeia archaeon]
MAEPIRDPKRLQSQVQEFQKMQRQMQILGIQRQQMQMQIEELTMAQEALKGAKGEVYQAVGNLLVPTDVAKAKKDIDEKLEIFDVRQKTIAKQEEQMKSKFDSLRSVLEKETTMPS